MSHRLLAVFVLSSFAFAGAGKIGGKVVDQNGMPVPHITVEASVLDMASSGGVPQATTDDQGRFVINVVSGRTREGQLYGQRYAVYARRDDSDYYPHLTPFYETPSNRVQVVALSLDAPEANVIVKLGAKAGALTGHATDSRTGAVLHPDFEFAWASGEPNKRMGKRTGDPYRILLPSDTDIKLVVQCEGYKPWTYPGVINVGPGQDMTLDIRLEPIATKR